MEIVALKKRCESTEKRLLECWRIADVALYRVKQLEKQLQGVADMSLEIGKHAAPVKTVSRLASNAHIQGVVAPNATVTIFRPDGSETIVEPPDPPRPEDWKPAPNSDDPMERAYATSLAQDGDRNGRLTAPRRRSDEGDGGTDAILKQQAALHAGLNGKK